MNQIEQLIRNRRYQIGNLPDTMLSIYDKSRDVIEITVTINDCVLYEESCNVNEDELIGIYKGTIYKFKNRDEHIWEIDDLTPIFHIPHNLSELAYDIWDCRNCVGCGAYSLETGVNMYSKLWDMNPAIIRSMISGIKKP